MLTKIMDSVHFYLCVFFFLQTVSGQCPVNTAPLPCYDDDSDEGVCEGDDDCGPGEICCVIGCSTQCVYPLNTTMDASGSPPQTKPTPCVRQSECEAHQCCTNSTSGAQTGICQDRKQVADDCHNPYPTGFYHSGCRSPSAITHPDLCPCDCDYMCSPGPPDLHGGYRGICMFS